MGVEGNHRLPRLAAVDGLAEVNHVPALVATEAVKNLLLIGINPGRRGVVTAV